MLYVIPVMSLYGGTIQGRQLPVCPVAAFTVELGMRKFQLFSQLLGLYLIDICLLLFLVSEAPYFYTKPRPAFPLAIFIALPSLEGGQKKAVNLTRVKLTAVVNF
jgi:hypothetical protein